MSNTSKVAAMENTPSLNASIREELRDRGTGTMMPDLERLVLRSYRQLAKERADLEALLVKLAPAWGRQAPEDHEVNRVLER